MNPTWLGHLIILGYEIGRIWLFTIFFLLLLVRGKGLTVWRRAKGEPKAVAFLKCCMLHQVRGPGPRRTHSLRGLLPTCPNHIQHVLLCMHIYERAYSVVVWGGINRPPVVNNLFVVTAGDDDGPRWNLARPLVSSATWLTMEAVHHCRTRTDRGRPS